MYNMKFNYTLGKTLPKVCSHIGVLDVNSTFKIKNPNFKAVFKNMPKLVREGRGWQ